jgi:hypothetical protein
MKSLKQFFKDNFTVPGKPYALPFDEWDTWYAQARKDFPVRYFFGETVPDAARWINNHTFGKFNDVRYHLYNRFIYKKYALTSKLPRGDWYDFDTRMLNCMMDEVVDFVEVETAIHHCIMDKGIAKKYGYNRLKNRWLFKKFRSAGAGIEHLNWAASLRSSAIEGAWVVESEQDEKFGPLTGQAETALEVLDIYHWWTSIRPARPDPYDTSGWSKYCDEGKPLFSKRADGNSGTVELDKLHEIEVAYEKEDTEYLIRVVKVRRGLWT